MILQTEANDSRPCRKKQPRECGTADLHRDSALDEPTLVVERHKLDADQLRRAKSLLGSIVMTTNENLELRIDR